MGKYKYIMSDGLAFGEEKDMKKLSNYAKKGWILTGNSFLGYRLKKDKPQNLIYATDIRRDEDDDYFMIFKEAGWTHLYSVADIHYFSAVFGTMPIYTEKESLIEKYEQEMQLCGRISVLFLIIIIISQLFMGLNILPAALDKAAFVIFYISLLPFIFTSAPYVGYKIKRWKLIKQC